MEKNRKIFKKNFFCIEFTLIVQHEQYFRKIRIFLNEINKFYLHKHF